MTLTIDVLLERGYFPQELPPPFNTKSLASFIRGYSGKPLPFSQKKNRVSKPELYNLARTGTLRRELSILNPIHFTLLAQCIASNWKELEKGFSGDETFSYNPCFERPFTSCRSQKFTGCTSLKACRSPKQRPIPLKGGCNPVLSLNLHPQHSLGPSWKTNC